MIRILRGDFLNRTQHSILNNRDHRQEALDALSRLESKALAIMGANLGQATNNTMEWWKKERRITERKLRNSPCCPFREE